MVDNNKKQRSREVENVRVETSRGFGVSK